MTIPDPNTHNQRVYALDVKTELLRRNIKQRELAAELGIAEAAFSKALRGQNEKALQRIREYLQSTQIEARIA